MKGNQSSFALGKRVCILRAVKQRALRIFLAAYLFFWFGIVVPGHQRGIVTVDGTPNASECCCCCQTSSANQSPSKTPTDSQAPGNPTNPAGHCAICYFAAHLTVPPPVDFSLAPLGLVARVRDAVVKDCVARIVLTPYDGRGPPAVA